MNTSIEYHWIHSVGSDEIIASKESHSPTCSSYTRHESKMKALFLTCLIIGATFVLADINEPEVESKLTFSLVILSTYLEAITFL